MAPSLTTGSLENGLGQNASGGRKLLLCCNGSAAATFFSDKPPNTTSVLVDEAHNEVPTLYFVCNQYTKECSANMKEACKPRSCTRIEHPCRFLRWSRHYCLISSQATTAGERTCALFLNAASTFALSGTVWTQYSPLAHRQRG